VRTNVKWLLALIAAMAIISGASTASVPLTPTGDGHVAIPVEVDDKGPFPFILDTGADSTAVYQWFADRAGLKRAAGPGESWSGQTGTIRVSFYQVRSVRADGWRLSAVRAGALPNRHDAGRQAGVLGNDFMDKGIAVFDFPCRRVELRARGALRTIVGDDGPPVDGRRAAGSTPLNFPVTVNGIAGIAVLDTGSRNTRINLKFASLAGIDPKSPAFHDGDALFGIGGGTVIPRNGPIGTLAFSGMTLRDVRAQVMDVTALTEDFGEKPSMLLGLDVLGQFRVIYDHRANHIWFRPSTCAR
jgi:predicted aspartyl protease